MATQTLEDPTLVPAPCPSGVADIKKRFVQGQEEIKRLRAELIIWSEDLKKREDEIVNSAECPEEELLVLHTETAAQAEQLRCIVGFLRQGMWEAALTGKTNNSSQHSSSGHSFSPRKFLPLISRGNASHVKERHCNVQTPMLMTHDMMHASGWTTSLVRQESKVAISPVSGVTVQRCMGTPSVIMGPGTVAVGSVTQSRQSSPRPSPPMQQLRRNVSCDMKTMMGTATSLHGSVTLATFKPACYI